MFRYVADELSKLFTNSTIINPNNTSSNNSHNTSISSATVDLNNNQVSDKPRELAGLFNSN